MNKMLLAAAVGAVLITAGCASDKHDHDLAGGSSSEGHHSMMEGHHEEMMEGHDKGKMMEGHEGMEGMGHAHGSEGSLAGEPGKEVDVTRVIKVAADDTMRFSHEPFNIKDGETIKFVVTNNGVIPHEFAIGTKDEHTEHGQMMMNNPNMHHGPGGNAITIKPGESKVLIWKFESAWQVEAACNIPGHYQAGMHSPVTIKE